MLRLYRNLPHVFLPCFPIPIYALLLVLPMYIYGNMGKKRRRGEGEKREEEEGEKEKKKIEREARGGGGEDGPTHPPPFSRAKETPRDFGHFFLLWISLLSSLLCLCFVSRFMLC